MRILENISLRKKRLRIEMLIRLNNRSANTPRFEYKKSVVTNKFITVSQKNPQAKLQLPPSISQFSLLKETRISRNPLSR